MKADAVISDLRKAIAHLPAGDTRWDDESEHGDPLVHGDGAMAAGARYVLATSPARMAVLLDEVETLRRLLNEAWEEIERWKDASGITKGGDPSDVEPSDLERFQTDRSAVERSARAVVAGTMRELSDALVALDAAWPEQS